MPWLPLYADEKDFKVILDWFNQNDEVAFIVPDGSKRWKAVASVSGFCGNRVCLWHVPSGALPLLGPVPNTPHGIVPNPWAGWEELRTGADSTVPYFGAGHPGIIWLNVRIPSKSVKDGLGLSSFEWIGNRYSITGNPAHETTEKFWLRLRRWIKKLGKQIPRSGPIDGLHPEIWALPSALAAFELGVGRDPNPTM